jgi:hypothetical protein
MTKLKDPLLAQMELEAMENRFLPKNGDLRLVVRDNKMPNGDKYQSQRLQVFNRYNWVDVPTVFEDDLEEDRLQ